MIANGYTITTWYQFKIQLSLDAFYSVSIYLFNVLNK